MRTEVLGIGIGDILKFEATALTRVKVKVPDGTRAGDWVNFSLRDSAHLLPAVEAKVAERIIAKAKELRYL